MCMFVFPERVIEQRGEEGTCGRVCIYVCVCVCRRGQMNKLEIER